MTQQTAVTDEREQQRQSNMDVVQLVLGVLGIGIGAVTAGFVSFQTYDVGLLTHAAFSAAMIIGGLAVFVGYFENAAVAVAGVGLGLAVWVLLGQSGALAMAGAGLAVGSVVFAGAAVFERARRRLVGEPPLGQEERSPQN